MSSLYEQPNNLIGYLVHRRFGAALRTVAAEPQQTQLFAGIAAYRAELEELSGNDLKSRAKDECASEEREQDEKDKLAFSHWTRLAMWTLDEAAALTLKMDPDSLTRSSLESSLEEVGTRFSRLRRQLRRAREAHELTDPVSPKKYVDWADANAVALPRWLKQSIDCGQATDWKGMYEASQQQLSMITGELERLKKADKALGSKERNTFNKLLLGLAVAGYGYDHRAARSSVPNEIASDLARLGIDLDEDTVRKKLREAADQYRDLLPISQPANRR